jgi:prophage regulatory protein
MSLDSLPATGFVRLPTIIGDPESVPPKPALIPVCSSSWWNGIKKGIYPKPIKIGPNTTAWRVEDIRNLINQLGGEQ